LYTTLSCFDDAIFDLVGTISITPAITNPATKEGLATVDNDEVLLFGIVEKVGDSSSLLCIKIEGMINTRRWRRKNTTTTTP
jgi:hypothetical protein